METRRVFLGQAFAMLFAPSFSTIPSGCAGVVERGIEYGIREELSLLQIFAEDRYSEENVAKMFVKASGNLKETTQLRLDLAEHFRVCGSRLEFLFKDKARANKIQSFFANPEARNIYEQRLASIDPENSAGLPSWKEFKEKLITEINKPVDYYAERGKERVAQLDNLRNKTSVFADMASLRKARLYPVTRPWESSPNPYTPEGKQIIYAEAMFSGPLEVLVANLSNSCEEKTRCQPTR